MTNLTSPPRFACHASLWPEKHWQDGLDEMVELGFKGVEGLEILRQNYGQKTELAVKLLEDRKLTLVGLAYQNDFANPDLSETVIRECRERIEFLNRVNSPWLNLDLGSREVFLTEREDFKHMADLLNRIALRASDLGVGVCVRNHRDHRIQTESDIDRLLNLVDMEIVTFSPDPAHLYRAKENPARILSAYISCVRHLYFQDAVLDEDHPEGGYFCEPGEGTIDFSPLVSILKNWGYRGWITARLDVEPKDASESASKMYSFLQKNFNREKDGS